MVTGEYEGTGTPSEFRTAVTAALPEESSFAVSVAGPVTEWSTGSVFARLVELRKWADLTIVLPRPAGSPRTREIVLMVPTGWAHIFRIYAPDEIEGEIAGWIVEARELAAGVAPMVEDFERLSGRSLEQFSATFSADVVGRERGLFVPLPEMVRLALGGADRVDVTVGGIEYSTTIESSDGRALVPVDGVTGLEEGRSTEVSLKVRT